MYQLTDQDREILDALAATPRLDEVSSSATLHARFGNLTLFWQHVNALLNTEAAEAHAPGLVHRLRRRRARRRVA